MFDTLENVRVIELAVSVLGAACGKILAEHGAEVIVIESPEGGRIREQADFYDFWQGGKKSVSLRLHTAEGRFALERLIAGADVFLTDLGSASKERLDLREKRVRGLFPSLIYANAEALGGRGDAADPVEDVSCFWARSGYLRDFAEAGTIMRPADHMGACVLAQSLYLAIAGALFSREATKKGCTVSSSLYGNAIYGTHYQISMVQNGKEFPMSRKKPIEAMANTYRCKDGWIVFYDNQFDRHFWKMMKAIGLGHLEGDPRWACRADTMGDRAPELIEILDEAVEALRSVDMAVERAWRSEDLAGDPQALKNGYLQECRISTGPHRGMTVKMPISPVSIDRKCSMERMPAGPKLGEHTQALLAELDL